MMIFIDLTIFRVWSNRWKTTYHNWISIIAFVFNDIQKTNSLKSIFF